MKVTETAEGFIVVPHTSEEELFLKTLFDKMTSNNKDKVVSEN